MKIMYLLLFMGLIYLIALGFKPNTVHQGDPSYYDDGRVSY